MTKQDYRYKIVAPISAADVYDKIGRVSDWWAKNFEGSASNLGDKFTVRFQGSTSVTWVEFEITEAVPVSKVVWSVTDCHLPWLSNKTEWNGTNVVIEIAADAGETTVTMTHEGLVPELECFNDCLQGWNFHFGESFKQFVTVGQGMPK